MRIAGQSGWLTDPKYKQPGFKVGPPGSGTCRALASRAGAGADVPMLATSVTSSHHLPPTFVIPISSPHKQVLHVPDFDFNTNCILLADCLAELKRWSGAANCAGDVSTARGQLGVLWL